MLHIVTAIGGLADHPMRHPQDRVGRREFSVEGHRVRYRLLANGDVRVIRVFGRGQDRGR